MKCQPYLIDNYKKSTSNIYKFFIPPYEIEKLNKDGISIKELLNLYDQKS